MDELCVGIFSIRFSWLLDTKKKKKKIKKKNKTRNKKGERSIALSQNFSDSGAAKSEGLARPATCLGGDLQTGPRRGYKREPAQAA